MSKLPAVKLPDIVVLPVIVNVFAVKVPAVVILPNCPLAVMVILFPPMILPPIVLSPTTPRLPRLVLPITSNVVATFTPALNTPLAAPILPTLALPVTVKLPVDSKDRVVIEVIALMDGTVNKPVPAVVPLNIKFAPPPVVAITLPALSTLKPLVEPLGPR